MPNVIPNKQELKTGANALSGLMMGDKRNPGISTAWDAMKGTLQSKIGDRTNFGPNDSVIGSTIHHPMMGIEKALEWLSQNIQTASGMPNPAMQDEGSMYQMGPSTESQAQAGLNVAGMAQLGSMPMAPRSAGGTLGTMTSRGSRYDVPVGQKWKSGLDATNQGRNIPSNVPTQDVRMRGYIDDGYRPEGIFKKK